MTFDELLAEVYSITDRPDLENETKTAVRAATIKAHNSDFYSKDIHEQGVEFESASYRQSLDYISLISNFRALKYIRLAESATDDSGSFLDIVLPEEVLDSYGYNRANIAYVAGRVLEMRAATEFKYMLLGCYVQPIVRTGAYASWVAEQHPYAIVYEACRLLFKMIGYDDQSTAFANLVTEEYSSLKKSALSDVGY